VKPRFIFLKVHLYLGLIAAIFLLLLSVTGTIMAFEHDIERWLHPGLWKVTPGNGLMPEDELVRIAEQTAAPARVASVQISPRPDVAQVMQLTDRSTLFINPWNGTVNGRTFGTTATQRYIGYIHQLHLRLIPNPQAVSPALSANGKLLVSFAGLILCLLVPTGLILWWRTRRGTIHWSGSWFRISFDMHQVIGIYACIFLFIAAFTGVMVGFDFAERQIYNVMRSPEPNRPRPPQASEPAGRTRISVDQAIAAARNEVSRGDLVQVQIPTSAKMAYVVQFRAPNDPSVDAPVPVSVFVDPYSSEILRVQNLFAESPGYWGVRLNRAIHTGDYLGSLGHVITSLSSFLLGVMVLTGLIIWWKKLAI
jgi:uncharacterized iron-regulated membrane protein